MWVKIIKTLDLIIVSLNRLTRTALSIATVCATTAVIAAFKLDTILANASMLYLLNVFIVGILAGRTAAIISSILSFGLFDFFFTQPLYTLQVGSPDEWITLLVFLFVSTVTGQLSAKLKESLSLAQKKEDEAADLARASWIVSSQLTFDQALESVLMQLIKLQSVKCAAVVTIDHEAKGETRETVRVARGKDGNSLDQTQSTAILQKIREQKLQEPDICSKIGISPVRSGAIYLQLDDNLGLLDSEKRLLEALVNHAGVVLQKEELSLEQNRTQALADADRLKTALLAMVSHDFKSPLTGIKASVTALLHAPALEGKGSFDAETRSLLEGIEIETDRLDRMVGNILSLSRLEADAWHPLIETCSIDEIVGSALQNFSSEDNARIRVGKHDFVELECDPVQIEQVVKNLVENALKYSTSEQMVEIQLERDAVWTRIIVEDRGIGIQAEQKELIFERFFRATAQQESAIAGAGLGLAICKALVLAHHGNIWAAQREGGGSVFTVELPNR